MEGYDLIGDIHGCGATLAALLEKLGYHQRGGVYRHPRRKVIFLGDLIDRGPRIRLAVTIARRMVEAGEAHIVMGNHEYNALAYTHPAPSGSHKRWLREHTPRHNRIIQDTLDQYRHHTNEWEDTLAWFKTIPLFLELDGIRVVHACWDDALISELKQRLPTARMDDQFLVESLIVLPVAPIYGYQKVSRFTRGTVLPDKAFAPTFGQLTRSSGEMWYFSQITCPAIWKRDHSPTVSESG